jgi:hypothetical protein
VTVAALQQLPRLDQIIAAIAVDERIVTDPDIAPPEANLPESNR